MRIVQPNVPQAEKWRPEGRARELQKLIDLSRRDGFDRLAAVIWPETAPPFIVQPGSPGLAMLAAAAPPGGYLLAGAARSGANVRGGRLELAVGDRSGRRSAATYDKVHLVPFGEYIPFHKEWPPLTGLIGRGSFEKGEVVYDPGTARAAGLLAAHLLRGDFPRRGDRCRRASRMASEHHQRCMVRSSSGPYQHLVSARLRTIEEGLPMIRAANTGVSAVIDAYGRMIASLGMEQEGVIDHALPPARAATPYARWHDWTLLALLMILMSSVFLVGRKRQSADG